jgi:hypothetical protein
MYDKNVIARFSPISHWHGLGAIRMIERKGFHCLRAIYQLNNPVHHANNFRLLNVMFDNKYRNIYSTVNLKSIHSNLKAACGLLFLLCIYNCEIGLDYFYCTKETF